jgi:large subunit ribosomal protein L9
LDRLSPLERERREVKVILNQDIPNLGEEGDIKDVARGYARNFLIPKKLVMPYTREAMAIFASRREAIDARREEKRKAALDIKTRLESEALEIQMPAGDRGRLFGSVTSANIADALAAKGIEVERRRIDIPEKTIKNVGTVYVRVRLYGEEEAELRVDVTAVGGTKASDAPAESATSESPAAEAPTETEESAASGSETASDELAEAAADDSDSEAAPGAEESDADDSSDEEE